MGTDPTGGGSAFPGENPSAPNESGAGSEVSPSPTAPDTASSDRQPDCPSCGQGFLYPIAKTESGTLVHCFACQRSLSVPDEDEDVAPAVAGTDGPTAGQPTTQQLEAMREINPDHPAVRKFEQAGTGGGA